MEQKKNKSIFSDYPDIVTVGQLSKMLDISTKSSYKLLKEEKIRSIRVGRKYIIPKIFIIDYLGLS